MRADVRIPKVVVEYDARECLDGGRPHPTPHRARATPDGELPRKICDRLECCACSAPRRRVFSTRPPTAIRVKRLEALEVNVHARPLGRSRPRRLDAVRSLALIAGKSRSVTPPCALPG